MEGRNGGFPAEDHRDGRPEALLLRRNAGVSGLRPGRDISCFFFEHYCNLEPVFFSKYSSISRPYFDLGFKAGELLRRMVASGAPGETITLSAAFNDLGTI